MDGAILVVSGRSATVFFSHFACVHSSFETVFSNLAAQVQFIWADIAVFQPQCWGRCHFLDSLFQATTALCLRHASTFCWPGKLACLGAQRIGREERRHGKEALSQSSEKAVKRRLWLKIPSRFQHGTYGVQ